MTVDSSIYVHGSVIGVTADVLENVVFHPLVAHQRREHCAEGVGSELLVKPRFALRYNSDVPVSDGERVNPPAWSSFESVLAMYAK